MQARPSSASHAVVADVAERAHADVEPAPVRARQQAARPVAAGLEGGEPAPRRVDPSWRPACTERPPRRRCCRRRRCRPSSAMPNGWFRFSSSAVALLGHAVAVGIAQQRDAVGAHAERGGAAHGGRPSRGRTASAAGRPTATPRPPSRRRWAAPGSSAGASSPVAKALTLKPGAATGSCPGAQPCAVGIFSVGMRPCGRAAGIWGAAPTAALRTAPCSRRHRMAPAPTRATARAKTS